jgi:hypothetical protein
METYGLKELFPSRSNSDNSSGSGQGPRQHCDYSQLEYAVAQIELMGRQVEIIREIENRFFAHFIFLLILATRAAIAEDEARFAEFNAWLRCVWCFGRSSISKCGCTTKRQ